MAAMSVSWVFLLVSAAGLVFTLNAHRPVRRTWLMVPSFFAGWLTSELPMHHVTWQLAATFGFAGAGAFTDWPGWVGLALCMGSWTGLVGLIEPAQAAHPEMRRAVAEASGSPAVGKTKAPPLRIPLNPFAFGDPRVQRSADIPYVEGGGARQQLDVYRQTTGVEQAPVLLQIHGGAWMIGEKRQQGLPLMMELARRGWVCVALNYRLSPRHAWPTHLEDCKRALAWVREHIREFGGDPGFVAVTGGSAGGHLSSLMALTQNDPRHQAGFESVDTSVTACVPFYGVYDWTQGADAHFGSEFRRVLEQRVVQRPYEEAPEVFRDASPIHRVKADLPPFLVIHGTHDSLAPVEGARDFVARLRERSEAAVGYAELQGAQHAFDIFHSARSKRVVSGVVDFLEGVHARHRSGQNAAS